MDARSFLIIALWFLVLIVMCGVIATMGYQNIMHI
jgi:hypothetical protein